MTILAILIGLFGLFLCLVSIPVDLKLKFDSVESPRFRWRIGWLFNLIELDFPPGKRLPEKRKKRVKRGKKHRRAHQFLRFCSRPLLLQVLDLIREIHRAAHLKQLHADIRAGLGEPADTGVLFGAVSVMFPFWGMPNTIRMRWEPDFGEEPTLEGTLEGQLRLRPIGLMPAVVSFVFSKPVLLTIRRELRLWNRV